MSYSINEEIEILLSGIAQEEDDAEAEDREINYILLMDLEERINALEDSRTPT